MLGRDANFAPIARTARRNRRAREPSGARMSDNEEPEPGDAGLGIVTERGDEALAIGGGPPPRCSSCQISPRRQRQSQGTCGGCSHFEAADSGSGAAGEGKRTYRSIGSTLMVRAIDPEAGCPGYDPL